MEISNDPYEEGQDNYLIIKLPEKSFENFKSKTVIKHIIDFFSPVFARTTRDSFLNFTPNQKFAVIASKGPPRIRSLYFVNMRCLEPKPPKTGKRTHDKI